MRIVLRLALTLILTNVTAFCCLEFLASFDPPGSLVSRWLYGAVTVACIIAIVAVWIVRTARHRA